MIILLNLLINFIKNIFFFTGSYSNTVFKDPLTSDEEEKYIALMQQGDKEARNILIEHNLRLVAHIVKKFNPPLGLTDDLISIGTIGLIKGIDSYQSNKNIKITTYAARCIENEILMYYRSSRKFQNTVSLDDYIGTDKEGNKINLKDVIKDKSKPIEEELYLKDNINLLKQFLNRSFNAFYVTKNSAPRDVFKAKLKIDRMSGLNNLFKGSGCFYECEPNSFDVLIVDEAHRLNKKSGFILSKDHYLGTDLKKVLINKNVLVVGRIRSW